MKDLFENILYLIPIAFFIVIRILNARSKDSQKQQDKESTKEIGDIFRRFQDEDEKPVVEKTAAEDMYYRKISPDHHKRSGEAEPKKKAAKKAARSAQKKDEAPVIDNAAAMPDISVAANTPAANGVLAAYGTLAIAKLPQIQQALVWSEILGHPKGFSPDHL